MVSRPASPPTAGELAHGVPLFLDQLADTLRRALNPTTEILEGGTQLGGELLRGGFTIAQVVNNYEGICHAITELANELDVPIASAELRTLHQCLGEAMAAAVTEYTRLREHEGTERLGRLAHELRNQLNNATLAHDMLKRGLVGAQGSTSAVLTRSLVGLQSLIDRELADVRLGAGIYYREEVVVRDFIADVEATAALDAAARRLELTVDTVDDDVVVYADRQILASMVGNLLQNAFKFTQPKGHVVLRVHASAERVLIDVEDQCGGLPPGGAERLFGAFEQSGVDRSGLGLGLSICGRGARINDGMIQVLDRPGIGCVFTVDLPRRSATAR
jgi:hypothetical protein